LSGTGEIFTDDFIGLGTFFYFPYVGDGAKPDVFSVDGTEGYESEASIRIDVPNANDPTGNFAGASFVIDGSGRNLTEFDALTFWIKSSQATAIASLSFGDVFRTEITNVSISTNWQQYTIPIPDPSRLVDVKTVFAFSAGGIGSVPGTEVGYSFWIDELKFEKLGTIAQSRPAILGGEDVVEQTFLGSGVTISGLTQTFNLVSGLDQTAAVTPSYFTFSSTDVDVARVSELGEVSIVGIGTAEITALLGDVKAAGSLTIESLGTFTPAPIPSQDPSNVISVFSDAYTNIPVDFYNGFFAPYQTTLGGSDLNINGDHVIKYTDLNFVATEFQNPTANVSSMTHLHVDIQVEEAIDPTDVMVIELGDFGPNGAFGGGDDSSGRFTIPTADLKQGQWVSVDVPLTNFGLASTANMAQIFFISDASISNILVDNMYFYK
jgi:hypothetical protein